MSQQWRLTALRRLDASLQRRIGLSGLTMPHEVRAKVPMPLRQPLLHLAPVILSADQGLAKRCRQIFPASQLETLGRAA